MKRMMIAAALAAMSVAFVGCGGKPKIPANTVAAAYVNVDRAIWNAAEIADDIIDAVKNDDLRKMYEEQYKTFIKENKDDIRALGLDWACVTAGMDKDTFQQEIAVAVKCDCEAKLKAAGDQSLVDLAKAAFGNPLFEANGCGVYFLPLGGALPTGGIGVDGVLFTFVEGKYIVATAVSGQPGDTDQAFMKKMVALYKDNDGEKSGEFDDLAALGDDAVARVQTAGVNAIVDLFGFRKAVEEFAEKCGDDDLVEMLTDISNVTLDVNLSDDTAGLELSVDAGSKELAKLVEGLFNVVAFSDRVLTAWAVGMSDMVEGAAGKDGVTALKAASGMLRECIEADRSGSVAKLKIEIDTDDLIDEIVPELTK